MADEPKLIPIRFSQKQSPYNAGEVAGFTPETAQRYVDAKLAEFYDADKVVSVSGEEVVLNVGGEEKTVSEEEQRAAAAAAEKELQASPSHPIDHEGERIDVSKKDDPVPGDVSQEHASGEESTAAGGSESQAAGSRKKR